MKGFGNIKLDFEAEWQDLVAGVLNVSVKPVTAEPVSDEGWKSMSGYAPFELDGGPSIAMLVTISGYNKRMSILVLTNTKEYQPVVQSFLESVELKIPDPNSSTLSDRKKNMPPFIGTWGKADEINNKDTLRVPGDNSGYCKSQYTFNDDGSYNFVSKTYESAKENILLVKESGTFSVDGNNLLINPQNSLVESWSKKNGTDACEKLVSTGKREIEKITYRLIWYYFRDIQEWSLVLQFAIPTLRDGPFSRVKPFSNAWYYFPVSANNPLIDLP
jgi:hypothetical protein